MSVRYWILSTAPTVLTSIYQYCCLFKDQLDGIGVYPFQHTDPRTHISIKKMQIREHQILDHEGIARKLCSPEVWRVGSECIFHILLVEVT